MNNHRSIRNFENQSLTDQTKQSLLTAARAGSSSNFVQATSIIEIQDNQIRTEIADISQSATYVNQSGAFYIFVADLYRQSQLLNEHHRNLAPLKTMESLLVSVVDTTIAAENMAVAAESLGLGICFIGGIRNNLPQISKLLQLPKYTVPLFGMTIGIPTSKNAVKPRMPLNNFTATDHYDPANFTDLTQYDAVMQEYYQNRPSHPKQMDWSTSQLDFFKTLRRPEVTEFIHQQGFLTD
ncbi:hypothetical protein IV57_GL000030 [Companilactobacillus kimchiensis]|uniref:Nitroreductase domain-containing protein n=2 Tax=Companilactobacillus kimchiensis TaxID=993692 RepID=A0A0R2LQQ5_9LACO|nr:hypothetical protein IV57_GL000030 [Companilactobacillus kimchiensis]